MLSCNHKIRRAEHPPDGPAHYCRFRQTSTHRLPFSTDQHTPTAFLDRPAHTDWRFRQTSTHRLAFSTDQHTPTAALRGKKKSARLACLVQTVIWTPSVKNSTNKKKMTQKLSQRTLEVTCVLLEHKMNWTYMVCGRLLATLICYSRSVIKTWLHTLVSHRVQTPHKHGVTRRPQESLLPTWDK